MESRRPVRRAGRSADRVRARGVARSGEGVSRALSRQARRALRGGSERRGRGARADRVDLDARRDVRAAAPGGRQHRPGARRARAARPRAEHADRDRAALLRPRVERRRRRRRRGAARRPGGRALRPGAALAAPLQAAPALRAGGEDLGGEEPHRRQRLGTALQRAALRPQRLARRQRPLARRGAREALARDVAGGARPRRRGGHGDTASGRAHARLRPQHDPERARDRGPAARLRHLDLGAQPRERDPRRGGAEPRRRDPVPLRHPAALLRAEGAAARPRPAEGLRPLRAAPGGRRHDRVGGGAGDRARRLQRLLAAGGRHRLPTSSTRTGSTPRCGPGRCSAPSARRRCPACTPTC